jgi:hypothetical protein
VLGKHATEIESRFNYFRRGLGYDSESEEK